MADFTEQALKAWSDGYRVIPVKKNKNPAINSWKKYQTERMSDRDIKKYFKDCWGVALLMGTDMKLIAFDFDLKYDLSRTVMDRFKKFVGEEILSKCYIQSTMNGGFHIVFSCPEMVRKNRKLACRKTTPYEQHQIYMDYWNDPASRDKAINAAYQDKIRVLIETREEGGYILVPGSPGYTYQCGQINTLTKEEALVMFEAAYSINEVLGIAKVYDPDSLSKQAKSVSWGTSPYDDFNENFDLIEFLENHGWTKVYESDKNVRLKRPGDSQTKDSAIYDKETKKFFVFSTSTEFNTEKTYSHVDTVCLILFGEEESTQMYNYMIEEGYGQ